MSETRDGQRYYDTSDPGSWDNTTPTTRLAIGIRERLGKHNDPTKSVVDLVEGVVEAHEELLAACEEAVAEIKGLYDKYGYFDTGGRRTKTTLERTLEAAIAKATKTK